jgi:hypothetical protein
MSPLTGLGHAVHRVASRVRAISVHMIGTVRASDETWVIPHHHGARSLTLAKITLRDMPFAEQAQMHGALRRVR